MKRTKPKTKKHTKSGQTASLRCDALAPGSVSYALFEHMAREHHITLIGYEIDEIIRVVNSALEERLRWWISNAEQIAKERGELFRAGEEVANELRRPRERRCVVLTEWDAAAQPMRDMIAALSPNAAGLPRAGDAPAPIPSTQSNP